MKLETKKLIVKYNNRIVGYLEELSNKRIAFQYDKDWVKEGFSISPFSLPLTDDVYISSSKHFSGLYGVFYDSLPDGWGELLVRRMLMKQGVNFDRISPLVKLSLLPLNGKGALTYEPSQNDKTNNKDADLDRISEEIKEILSNQTDKENLDKIYALAGASGGARPKVYLNIDDIEWIVKFPSSIDPKTIGSLEYKANLLASKSNINVNEFKLFPSKKYFGFFGAKRFDRVNSKRIHMISLSSILETDFRIPNLDYAHLFQVIQKICADQEDIYEAYKRMCFNVLYGNFDDHGNNFAFLYDESLKGYKLSPFYDITKTTDQIEHQMTVLGQGKPNEKDLIDIAKHYNLSMTKCTNMIKHIKQVIEEN
jgi:serine/threonine-protein kinase HipA